MTIESNVKRAVRRRALLEHVETRPGASISSASRKLKSKAPRQRKFGGNKMPFDDAETRHEVSGGAHIPSGNYNGPIKTMFAPLATPEAPGPPPFKLDLATEGREFNRRP